MGDFLGSYFNESDEKQIRKDIELYSNEQPATILSFNEIEKEEKEKHKWNQSKANNGNEPLDTFDIEEEAEFSPVSVASMNSFDPKSMITLTLSRELQNLQISNRPDSSALSPSKNNELEETTSKNHRKESKARLKLSKALKRLRQTDIENGFQCTTPKN